MTCAALMNDDLGRGVHGGDVARAARVVEMDMRHDHGRQVTGADPEPGQRVPDHRRRGRGPGFHQARPVAPDQVPRRDPLVPGHAGVDLEHLVTQRGDVRRFVHRVILADG
jgi:hypothetical protein